MHKTIYFIGDLNSEGVFSGILYPTAFKNEKAFLDDFHAFLLDGYVVHFIMSGTSINEVLANINNKPLAIPCFWRELRFRRNASSWILNVASSKSAITNPLTR